MKRRDFFAKVAQIGSVVVLGVFPFMGCENQEDKVDEKNSTEIDPCSDLSGLSAQDLKEREGYQYVEKTPYADKTCDNCEFWIEPEEGKQCGGCDLFDGPIHAKGYCNGWGEV